MDDEHKLLHKEQNISGSIIRRYREKTNHILIIDCDTLDLRLKIWQKFFANMWNLPISIQKQEAWWIRNLINYENWQLNNWKIEKETIWEPQAVLFCRLEKLTELMRQKVIALLELYKNKAYFIN